MKTYISRGTICFPGTYGLTYRICDLAYYLNDNETFHYVFTPNYSVIGLLEGTSFQGIPGLNLDLKKKEYVRAGKIPTFISERVPGENREDLQELLAKVGLDYMDPIEYLIRTDEQYFGDPLFVLPYREKNEFAMREETSHKTNAALMKEALTHICDGDDVLFFGQQIDDSNRSAFHKVLLSMYARAYEQSKETQAEGIAKAAVEGKYKGRKPVHVDRMMFLDVLASVERKEITPKEGAHKLGISIDKYYRYKKQLMTR